MPKIRSQGGRSMYATGKFYHATHKSKNYLAIERCDCSSLSAPGKRKIIKLGCKPQNFSAIERCRAFSFSALHERFSEARLQNKICFRNRGLNGLFTTCSLTTSQPSRMGYAPDKHRRDRESVSVPSERNAEVKLLGRNDIRKSGAYTYPVGRFPRLCSRPP